MPQLLGTLLVQVASGIKKRSTQKQCENGWHSAGSLMHPVAKTYGSGRPKITEVTKNMISN